MIRSFFGIAQNPFSLDHISLLPFQKEIADILQVHTQQGGLCLIMGDPGTGKSVIKDAIRQAADKRTVIASIGRTLHTYTNTIKILCQAFSIEFTGDSFKCEKRLIEEAFNINRQGKVLMTIIDEAHLMEIATLRRLRLLFEDFPKNHNLILIGDIRLLSLMCLKVNHDIKSRVTYSVAIPKLNQDQIQSFILDQFDQVGLGHHSLTEEALALIARSSDGVLRKARNLCLASLLEAVRHAQKTVDIAIVNRVLVQPHYRIQNDLDAAML